MALQEEERDSHGEKAHDCCILNTINSDVYVYIEWKVR